ncbi:hypothetical protein MVEN_01857400 [Mycena venus]|uniref:BRCT domain-containing protein n=1 Tax=Mycena venus TaxID=2733690 RepID=A0A8H6XGT2_9AGAR|nr:hypothetical protein MVEN_01857400 [Mycena venus]
MIVENGLIFRGVLYHIDRGCDSRDLLRILLEEGGAKASDTAKNATRIIVDPAHFTTYERKYNAEIVTPESRYYSADPKIVFSSIVVSAVGPTASFVRTVITDRGGQWLPKLTADVTHLVVDASARESDFKGFQPIVVADRWVHDSLVQKALLPTASYEIFTEGERKVGRSTISAAKRFCEALHINRKTGSKLHDKLSSSISTGGPLPFVPFEILSKIFIEFRDITLDESQPSLSALLLVSQVCGRWRDIAHCTRDLWVYMPFNFHAKRHYRRIHKLLELWTARSHPRALRITVRSCYPRPENPVIDFILANASRICELSLNLPAAHFHRFLQAPAGSFPLLEKLGMDVIPKSETIYDPSMGYSRFEYFREDIGYGGDPDNGVLWEAMTAPITSLSKTPQLRSISVCTGGFRNLDSRMFPLAWGNLTNIDLTYVTLSMFDMAYLFPQFARVERLIFATHDEMGPSMPSIPRVRLPQLVELNYFGFDVNDISIFDRLILPRLTTLELRDACQESVYALRTNAAFALREITLVFVHLTIPRLSAFLREMPSLTSLELRMCLNTTDDFLLFLTYDSERDAVLPHLERLVLADYEQHFSESVMLGMLESRWGTTPFARGRIATKRTAAHASTPAVHRKVRERITEMVEEGLKFEYVN